MLGSFPAALCCVYGYRRLHAGAKISATVGEASVCAELQEDGQIRQQGDEGEPGRRSRP